jgi:hypothetical protein
MRRELLGRDRCQSFLSLANLQFCALHIYGIVLTYYDVSTVKISSAQKRRLKNAKSQVSNVIVSRKREHNYVLWFAVYVEHVNIGMMIW